MVERARVAALLGTEFGRLKFGPPVLHESRALGGMVLDDLAFALPDGETVPAWFLHSEGGPPVGAVLVAHAHGNRYGVGRDEFLDGRPALQAPWAEDLAALGLAALCIEMPCFGARANPPEGPLAKALLWQGETLFGRMLAELAAGVGFLAGHQGIRPDRIGVMGLSMGGTHAWWLAALDPRIRATVQMCCLADIGMLIAKGAHDIHGTYMTVPGLLRVATTGQVAGLAAPRPQLVCAGLQDGGTPGPAFERALSEMRAAYAAAGAADALETIIDAGTGHVETPAMRAAALDFLRRHLIMA